MEETLIIRCLKFYNNFYKNIIKTELKDNDLQENYEFIEDCCDNKQTQFLLSVIKDYILTKQINGSDVHLNETITEVSIAAILYYYYHVVLIETHYNDYLQTIDVKSMLFDYFNKGRNYYTFIKLTNDLIKGDDHADVTVRQKFLFMNETNILTK
jgi:hypothetical protein